MKQVVWNHDVLRPPQLFVEMSKDEEKAFLKLYNRKMEFGRMRAVKLRTLRNTLFDLRINGSTVLVGKVKVDSKELEE